MLTQPERNHWADGPQQESERSCAEMVIARKPAQRCPGLRLEVLDVLFQRHRQHGIDLARHLHSDRATRTSAPCAMPVMIRGAQLRNIRQMRIAMAGRADDDGSAPSKKTDTEGRAL